MATSPGVIQFHERVFDRCLHFYERVSCVFRIFMSEFEAKRPRLVVVPVKCSGHLTGTENRGPAHGPPSSLPPFARIAAADLHEQKNARPSTRTTGKKEYRRRNPHHRPARRDAALSVRGRKRKIRLPEGSERCLASMDARPRITNGGGFDHNSRRDGQNARHSQIPFQRSSLETLLSASKDGSFPQNPRWARLQKQEL